MDGSVGMLDWGTKRTPVLGESSVVQRSRELPRAKSAALNEAAAPLCGVLFIVNRV